MKVRISDIPHQGLTINETLSLAGLQARLQGGRGQEIKILKEPKVTLKVFKTLNGAETKGQVEVNLLQPCSRCILEKERHLIVKLNFNFHQKPDPRVINELAPDADFSDDIGIFYFEGEHIELEEVIQEAIILQLNLFWKPDCDSHGICKTCGVSRDLFEFQDEVKASTLGSLFKKAGLN